MKGGEDISLLAPPPPHAIPLEVKLDSDLVKLFVGHKSATAVSVLVGVISKMTKAMTKVFSKLSFNSEREELKFGFTSDNYMKLIYDKSNQILYFDGIPIRLNESVGSESGESARAFLVYEQYIELDKIVNMLLAGLISTNKGVKLSQDGGANFFRRLGQNIKNRTNKFGKSAKSLTGSLVTKGFKAIGVDESKILITGLLKMMNMLKGITLSGMVKLTIMIVEEGDGSVSLKIKREGGGKIKQCPPSVQCVEQVECTSDEEDKKHIATVATGNLSLSAVEDMIRSEINQGPGVQGVGAPTGDETAGDETVAPGPEETLEPEPEPVSQTQPDLVRNQSGKIADMGADQVPTADQTQTEMSGDPSGKLEIGDQASQFNRTTGAKCIEESCSGKKGKKGKNCKNSCRGCDTCKYKDKWGFNKVDPECWARLGCE